MKTEEAISLAADLGKLNKLLKKSLQSLPPAYSK